MKISYNWLLDYIDLSDHSIERIAEIMTDLGLEVASVEEVESIKGGLEGVVIGEVIKCQKHPNADKLSLTVVDIGNNEHLSIVCGAPNVAEGQKVPVATIGTKLYSADGEEWQIKKGKIRGEVSEGMICAEDELGIGISHEGIMVLPNEIKNGTLAKEYFQIEKDFVFDIDLTPNRSDATSHIGVAFDISAYLKVNEAYKGKITTPETDSFTRDYEGLVVEVEVEDEKACPRYSGVSLSDIEIKESPVWMQNRLKAIGVRPINNIVDITNYILHEYGQPLHAFDADKIDGKKIRVKKLENNTAFRTLDEVDRKLSDEDLMICDDNSSALCIAGVFGGLHSGVTDTTKNIFLESAHFSAKSVRKTSMKHLLRTDAAMVFEKGSDPGITVKALKRAAVLMKELAGGRISSPIIDVASHEIEAKKVRVRYEYVDRLIGIQLGKDKLKGIFAALEMDLLEEYEDSLLISIPTNKADVTREVDVIEEILRIYGLNNVPIPEKVAVSITPENQMENYKVRRSISAYLSNQSFYEAMSLSLSMSKKYVDAELLTPENFVYINNTSNVQLDILRPEMSFSALENLSYNQNRQQRNLLMFEFGRSYQRINEELVEKEFLTLYGMGSIAQKSWKSQQTQAVDYYLIKTHVANVLNKMNILTVKEHALKDARFDFATEWKSNNVSLVKTGKINSKLLRSFGIKQDVFYAEIDFDKMKSQSSNQMLVEEISKFPGVSRDLAIVMDRQRKFSEIEEIANKTIKKSLKSIDLFDVYDNEKQLGEGKISYAISLKFEDLTKTLKDKEVDKLMNKFIQRLEQNLQVQIRK